MGRSKMDGLAIFADGAVCADLANRSDSEGTSTIYPVLLGYTTVASRGLPGVTMACGEKVIWLP